MRGLAGIDGFKICLQDCLLPGFRPLVLHEHVGQSQVRTLIIMKRCDNKCCRLFIVFTDGLSSTQTFRRLLGSQLLVVNVVFFWFNGIVLLLLSLHCSCCDYTCYNICFRGNKEMKREKSAEQKTEKREKNHQKYHFLLQSINFV